MLVAGVRRELVTAAREGKGRPTAAELTAAMQEIWSLPEKRARALVKALAKKEPNLLRT